MSHTLTAQSRTWIVPLLVLFGLGLPVSGLAKGSPAVRTVWVGLQRGPLSPADAEKLETELVLSIGKQKQLRLVDVSGGALSDKALAHHAGGLAKLIDQGIDLLLGLKAKQAVEKLDRAIKLFEAQLTPLRDHELLHDAMLAKAEAQMVLKQRETAKNTLKRLAALKPKQAPSRNTHERPFVKLWESAKSDLGHKGSIEVHSQPPGALIQVDGRPSGSAPITAQTLHAGRHYVVARWPSQVIAKMVQLSPGQNLLVEIKASGPSHRIKRDLMSSKIHRLPPARLAKEVHKLSRIAEAKRVLIGSVFKKDKLTYLTISRFDDQGTLIAKGMASLKNIKRLIDAITDASIKGHFELLPDGSIGKKSEAELLPNTEDPEAEIVMTSSTADNQIALAEPQLIDTAPSATEETQVEAKPSWWLWAGIGLVILAGAGTGGVMLLTPPAQTTEVQVNLP